MAEKKDLTKDELIAKEIRRLRKEIIDRFPDAFIIAFKNGQRMDVNEAIRTFLQNKKK